MEDREQIAEIQNIIKSGCASSLPYPWCQKCDEENACWYHEAKAIVEAGYTRPAEPALTLEQQQELATYLRNGGNLRVISRYTSIPKTWQPSLPAEPADDEYWSENPRILTVNELWEAYEKHPKHYKVIAAIIEQDAKTARFILKLCQPELTMQGTIFLKGKQAGIKEVVEWVDKNWLDQSNMKQWQSKLKEIRQALQQGKEDE